MVIVSEMVKYTFSVLFWGIIPVWIMVGQGLLFFLQHIRKWGFYFFNSILPSIFRVCSPPEPFLLVLYNPTHSRPEFYECSTATGTSKMSFNLFTGYEPVHLNMVSV